MKLIFITLILGTLISACSPCTRLQRKCPPLIHTDTVVNDTTIYRDSVVLRYIKADSVFIYDSIYVNTGEVSYTSVTAETDLSFARAFIENQKLKLLLVQKDSVLAFKIDSAFRSNKKVKYITKTEIHEKIVKPKSFRFFMYGFFSLVAAFILVIVLRKII